MSVIVDGFKNFFGPSGSQAKVSNLPSAPSSAAPAKLSNLVSMRRSAPSGSEIYTLTLRTFEECTEVSDALRDGLSVIVNIGSLSESDQRNIYYFLLGLKSGVEGDISRITPVVFLLTPHAVAIVKPVDEVEPLAEAGDDLISSPFAK